MTTDEPTGPLEHRFLLDELAGPAELISPWRVNWIVDAALHAAGPPFTHPGGDLLTRRTPDARPER